MKYITAGFQGKVNTANTYCNLFSFFLQSFVSETTVNSSRQENMPTHTLQQAHVTTQAQQRVSSMLTLPPPNRPEGNVPTPVQQRDISMPTLPPPNRPEGNVPTPAQEIPFAQHLAIQKEMS